MKLKMPTYVDYIRDFLLAIIAIMAGTNIYSYFFSDIYISDSRLVFIDYIVYAIIICIGLNFLKIKKIKTANLLPALVITVIIHFVSLLIR